MYNVKKFKHPVSQYFLFPPNISFSILVKHFVHPSLQNASCLETKLKHVWDQTE